MGPKISRGVERWGKVREVTLLKRAQGPVHRRQTSPTFSTKRKILPVLGEESRRIIRISIPLPIPEFFTHVFTAARRRGQYIRILLLVNRTFCLNGSGHEHFYV